MPNVNWGRKNFARATRTTHNWLPLWGRNGQWERFSRLHNAIQSFFPFPTTGYCNSACSSIRQEDEGTFLLSQIVCVRLLRSYRKRYLSSSSSSTKCYEKSSNIPIATRCNFPTRPHPSSLGRLTQFPISAAMEIGGRASVAGELLNNPFGGGGGGGHCTQLECEI